MAAKGSAVSDEPVDVLFALHPKFNLMDMAGPLEVLTTALHDKNDPSKSLPLRAVAPLRLPLPDVTGLPLWGRS